MHTSFVWSFGTIQIKDTAREAHDDRYNEDMHLYKPELRQIAGAYTVSRMSMLAGYMDGITIIFNHIYWHVAASVAAWHKHAGRKAGRPSPSAIRPPLPLG